MTKSIKACELRNILTRIDGLRELLDGIDSRFNASDVHAPDGDNFVEASGGLIASLQRVREQISPVHFGTIGITLGRSDSIAKFFAFSFVNQDKRDLANLIESPFYGSGVYAIYYHGREQKAYRPLSCTETPIYVGKADPKDNYAETVEAQGLALHARLKEHAKNIGKTGLNLADFRYRAAAIQSGMQSAVEDFMIRLFQPVWNKEVRICYGIGKHGDSATTRANKRSPWDTMHPGRKWAADTTADQMKRAEIEKLISQHFDRHPVIPDKETLFKKLSLG